MNVMHYNLTAGLLTMGILGLSFLTNAQQRSIDLELHIETPENAAVIASGATFPLKLSVTNHGPDELREGDTIYIILPTRELSGGVMSTPIAVGEKYVLATEFELTAPVTSTGGEAELCAQLSDDPSTQIRDSEGNPVSVSYIDPVPDNNLICHIITIEGESSSIADNQAIKYNLQPYPNPANDVVYIPIDPDGNTESYVRIFDIAGKCVFNQKANSSAEKAIEVNTTGLRPGIYYIEHIRGATRSIGKLTIQH